MTGLAFMFFCKNLQHISCFFRFFAQTMLKMTISTRVWVHSTQTLVEIYNSDKLETVQDMNFTRRYERGRELKWLKMVLCNLWMAPYQENKCRGRSIVVHGHKWETIRDMTLPGTHKTKATARHDVTTQTAQGGNGNEDGHDHGAVANHLLSKCLKRKREIWITDMFWG